METLFCPNCREEVRPRVVKTPTFVGTVIVEEYCPKCGLMLGRRVEELKLPTRKVTRKGLYIAIEGISGSGKTLQARRLVDRLRREGYEALYVKEPYVKAIKEFLYKHRVDPDVEAYLFAADRIILQTEVVLPALEEGKVVVSDRSVYSSLAFQVARGVPEEFVLALNRSIRRPDLVILLDLPVSQALERIRDREVLTRFDERSLLERVRARYLELAKTYDFKIIDASMSPDEVAESIWRIAKERLAGHS